MTGASALGFALGYASVLIPSKDPNLPNHRSHPYLGVLLRRYSVGGSYANGHVGGCAILTVGKAVSGKIASGKNIGKPDTGLMCGCISHLRKRPHPLYHKLSVQNSVLPSDLGLNIHRQHLKQV
jgi:hypothetical protein